MELNDASHELAAYTFFEKFTNVPELLKNLVKYHTMAKIFLAQSDLYLLSQASIASLKRQKEFYSKKELDEFKSNPDYKLCLEFRKLDDKGKMPSVKVPGLSNYEGILKGIIKGKY